MNSSQVIFVNAEKPAKDLAEEISTAHKSTGFDIEVYFNKHELWSHYTGLNGTSDIQNPKDNSIATTVENILRAKNLEFDTVYKDLVICYYFRNKHMRTEK